MILLLPDFIERDSEVVRTTNLNDKIILNIYPGHVLQCMGYFDQYFLLNKKTNSVCWYESKWWLLVVKYCAVSNWYSCCIISPDTRMLVTICACVCNNYYIFFIFFLVQHLNWNFTFEITLLYLSDTSYYNSYNICYIKQPQIYERSQGIEIGSLNGIVPFSITQYLINVIYSIMDMRHDTSTQQD